MFFGTVEYLANTSGKFLYLKHCDANWRQISLKIEPAIDAGDYFLTLLGPEIDPGAVLNNFFQFFYFCIFFYDSAGPCLIAMALFCDFRPKWMPNCCQNQ